MKIYIIGKINGLSSEEYIQNFQKAEKNLVSAGWETINPCRLGITIQTPLSEILKKFKSISENIQAIYLLEDWEDSLEARLQKSLAIHAHMDIYFEQWHTIEYMEKLKQEVI